MRFSRTSALPFVASLAVPEWLIESMKTKSLVVGSNATNPKQKAHEGKSSSDHRHGLDQRECRFEIRGFG
jgi:hypothetical protein